MRTLAAPLPCSGRMCAVAGSTLGARDAGSDLPMSPIAPPSPCQHLSGMFSLALPTPSINARILFPGSLLVGTGVHDRSGAEDARMVARSSAAVPEANAALQAGSPEVHPRRVVDAPADGAVSRPPPLKLPSTPASPLSAHDRRCPRSNQDGRRASCR
jgi:hypothetical protein